MSYDFEINSRCINLLPEPAAALPGPVQEHIASLDTLTGRFGFPKSASRFLATFNRRHDIGYGTPLEVVEGENARAALDTLLSDIGSSAGPDAVRDYLYANQDEYLASRVIGHGVLSLVTNVEHDVSHGAGLRQALGHACLLAAHHPGFPITMVSGLLDGKAQISDDLRSGLLIGSPDDPEDLRSRLKHAAAAYLGVPPSDAGRAITLGYAMDRITPGTVPDEIRLNPDGTVKISGGEVIQKKYGLVAGDIRRAQQTNPDAAKPPAVAELYRTIIERITTEADAAITAAQAHGPELVPFITEKSQEAIREAQQAQDGALGALENLGVSGEFSRLAAERPRIAEALRTGTEQESNAAFVYALATYDAIAKSI